MVDALPSDVAEWDDMVLVGTIVKTHGLRGHVVVHPATDFVEERFQAGARLFSRTDGHLEQLAVESARFQPRPVLVFAGYGSLDAAATLVGRELRIREADLQPLASGAYYHHQLVGCHVLTAAGDEVGTVDGIEGGASGSLLRVNGPLGEVLIPLAADICVTIDTAEKRIVVAPPDGLLEVNRPAPRRRRARRGGEGLAGS